MKKESADQFQLLAMQLSGRLNGRLEDLREECSPDEFKVMTNKFGKMMADLFMDIMKPIHQEHPDLMPKELGGSYEVDPNIYFDQKDRRFKLPGSEKNKE